MKIISVLSKFSLLLLPYFSKDPPFWYVADAFMEHCLNLFYQYWYIWLYFLFCGCRKLNPEGIEAYGLRQISSVFSSIWLRLMPVLQTATSYSTFLDIRFFSSCSGLVQLANYEPKVSSLPLNLIVLFVYFIKNKLF